MNTNGAALPLAGPEKQIAPAAKAILTSIEQTIQNRLGEIKKPASVTAFWASLSTWAKRNQTASLKAAKQKAAAPAARTKGTAMGLKHDTASAHSARRARTASAAA